MSATLRLDKFQLLWVLEGAVGKSHLRWDIYPMFVNDVWPQLTEGEREFIYTYARRDLSWHFEGEAIDITARAYFEQMLARFNPANQYTVTLKKGREKAVRQDDAYFWDGKYYVGWQRYCAPEYMKKVEKHPFRTCTNCNCEARDTCLRFLEHHDGSEEIGFSRCTKRCELIIERDYDKVESKRKESIPD